MPSLPSRALGALLAHHAGDSLGATVEFDSHARIAKHYPSGLRDIIGGGPFNWEAGHATDDTDMTRAMLLAYRDQWRDAQQQQQVKQSTSDEPTSDERRDGDEGSEEAEEKKMIEDIVHRTGKYFLSWFQGKDWPDRRPGSLPVDIGGATARSLQRLLKTGDPFTSGDDGPDARNSAGNGSLMRCIPTALMRHSSGSDSPASHASRLVRESIALSGITHADPRCTVSCAAYNAILSGLLHGNPASTAVERGLATAEQLEGDDQEHGVVRAIRLGQRLSVAEMAANGPSREDLPGGGAGYVLETLSLAVAAVLDARELKEVVVDVVRIGKDTDTNAAVAGGLLGARDGAEAVPEEWREMLQFGDEFEGIIKEMMGE